MNVETYESTADALHALARGLVIRVNGTSHPIADRTPTGRQVLVAGGLHPAAEYALIYCAPAGPTQELGLDEVINLQADGDEAEFFAHRADRVYYFVLDDDRFAWAGPLDETTVRQIGRVADDHAVWLERRDEPDSLIEPGATIDLSVPGMERLYAKPRSWKLDVQGVVIESDTSIIGVEDAIRRAGIDPAQGWIIVLKVKGQPKRQVQLSGQIDLTQPGIERLRLTPKQINNGEDANAPRQFALLPKDVAFLDKCRYEWQTINDGRRWLIINNLPLPDGYTQAICNLAVEIPQPYPAAELDMFYCHPPLTRINGTPIPQTEALQAIDGVNFQRWSRHRDSGQWSPQHDSVASHMGLVEESLLREVES